jgi:hypothetical protein
MTIYVYSANREQREQLAHLPMSLLAGTYSNCMTSEDQDQPVYSDHDLSELFTIKLEQTEII